MLNIFKTKLTNQKELEDKITLVHGDMANFKFDKKFSMIIAPFRAFQSITEDNDIKSSLTCVREHLSDDGIFIINVFNPYPVMDESWCYKEKIQWERLDEKTGNYIIKKHWGDKIDIIKQITYPHFAYEVIYPDGRTERITDDLKLKYYYYDQLKAVIEKADMEVIEEYSWYDKSPIGGREIIFVCKKKG